MKIRQSHGATDHRGRGQAREAASERFAVHFEAILDLDRVARLRAEHRSGVSVRERDRDVAVGVLVQDQRAVAGLGERAGRGRVVALERQTELDLRSGNDVDLLEMTPVEVELNVAEVVDVENLGADARVPDRGLGQLEPHEHGGIDGGAELLDRDTRSEVRRAAGAKMSRPWKVRDIGEAIGLVAQLVCRRDAAVVVGREGEQAVVRTDEETPPRSGAQPPAARCRLRDRRPPGARPRACTAACCARAARPEARSARPIPCDRSITSASGAMLLITPWQTPTKLSSDRSRRGRRRSPSRGYCSTAPTRPSRSWVRPRRAREPERLGDLRRLRPDRHGGHAGTELCDRAGRRCKARHEVSRRASSGRTSRVR